MPINICSDLELVYGSLEMASINLNNNTLAIAVAQRRWLRRLNLFDLPDYGFVKWKSWDFFVYLKDWKGPSFHVLKSGVESYEETNYRLIRQICKGDSVFLDVGANIGIFSFRLARDEKRAQIFSFEPEPHAYNCFNTTMSVNNVKAISLNKIALSDSDRTATFYFDGENHGGHSLDAQAIIQDGSIITQEIPVAVTTMDHFVTSRSLRKVTAVKIDVQRHEASVLGGSWTTIQKYRPIFLIEFYIEDLMRPQIFEAFKNAGDYSIFDMSQREFVAVEKYSVSLREGDNEYYKDLFLVPNEKKEELLVGVRSIN